MVILNVGEMGHLPVMIVYYREDRNVVNILNSEMCVGAYLLDAVKKYNRILVFKM